MKVIARMESRSGKYWSELLNDGSDSYSFRAKEAGSVRTFLSFSEALSAFKEWSDIHCQPDSAKTKMKFVPCVVNGKVLTFGSFF